MTPSHYESSKGKFIVREWSITNSFRERDENDEPLWYLPELHECLHGSASDTVEEGIRHVEQAVTSDLQQLRAWDWEDRQKREAH